MFSFLISTPKAFSCPIMLSKHPVDSKNNFKLSIEPLLIFRPEPPYKFSSSFRLRRSRHGRVYSSAIRVAVRPVYASSRSPVTLTKRILFPRWLYRSIKSRMASWPCLHALLWRFLMLVARRTTLSQMLSSVASFSPRFLYLKVSYSPSKALNISSFSANFPARITALIAGTM